MGNNTEVVLHDLKKRKVVAIENSHITGRSVGHRTNGKVLDAVLELCDEDGFLIGYDSKAVTNRALRSSHFLLKDEAGEPYALICVNQDVSVFSAMRDELDTLLSPTPLKAKPKSNGEGNIQAITSQLILDEIARRKPTNLDTKEAKLSVLRVLSAKGVFDVKDAVPQVCELLSISQATLYVYLREIRSKDSSLPC
jgi:predicted transcriptional regulator YheO